MEVVYRLSSYVSKAQDLAIPYWLIYFFIKAAIIQCCQCYHLWFGYIDNLKIHGGSFVSSNHLSNLTSRVLYVNQTSRPILDYDHSKNVETSRAYDLLVKFGSVYRELGTAAVFSYAIYTGIVLFYPANPLFRNSRHELYKKEFLVFLSSDSNLSRRMITKQMCDCINLVMESNLNYLKTVIGFMSVKDGGSWRRIFSKVHTQAANRQVAASFDYCVQAIFYKNLLQDKQLKISRPMECLIETLKRQYEYLIVLRRENSNLWPPNRSAKRRQKISMEFLHLQIMVLPIVYTMGQGSTIMAQYLGHNAIENNHQLPDKLREFSFGERCMFFDQFIFTGLAAYWFSSPIVMLIIIFKDLMMFLDSIKKKFKHFDNLVLKLDDMKCRRHFYIARMRSLKQTRHQLLKLNKDGRGMQQSDLLDRQIVMDQDCRWSINSHEKMLELEEDEHKIACDREALEIYLNFRIFLKQIEGPMLAAKYIMVKNIMYICYCLATTLVFFRGIKAEHLKFIVVLIVLVMALVNGALFVCAKFSSTCVKTFNSMFSLIARSLNHQVSSEFFRQALDQGNMKDGDCELGPRMSLLWPIEEISTITGQKKLRRRFATVEKHQSKFDEIHYMSEHPISPHTLILWRKLAQDHPLLMDRFVCTLAGVLKLDFHNIMRFNFWIISIVLLALTSRAYLGA